MSDAAALKKLIEVSREYLRDHELKWDDEETRMLLLEHPLDGTNWFYSPALDENDMYTFNSPPRPAHRFYRGWSSAKQRLQDVQTMNPLAQKGEWRDYTEAEEAAMEEQSLNEFYLPWQYEQFILVRLGSAEWTEADQQLLRVAGLRKAAVFGSYYSFRIALPGWAPRCLRPDEAAYYLPLLQILLQQAHLVRPLRYHPDINKVWPPLTRGQALRLRLKYEMPQAVSLPALPLPSLSFIPPPLVDALRALPLSPELTLTLMHYTGDFTLPNPATDCPQPCQPMIVALAEGEHLLDLQAVAPSPDGSGFQNFLRELPRFVAERLLHLSRRPQSLQCFPTSLAPGLAPVAQLLDCRIDAAAPPAWLDPLVTLLNDFPAELLDDAALAQLAITLAAGKPPVTEANWYTFKIKIRGLPEVWRRLRIRGNASFDDLHAAIVKSFSHDDDHLYRFYLYRQEARSESLWRYLEKSGCVKLYCPQDDCPPHVDFADETSIDETRLKVKDRLYFLFDFGDEYWHELSLESIAPGPLDGPWQCLEKKGKLPI